MLCPPKRLVLNLWFGPGKRLPGSVTATGFATFAAPRVATAIVSVCDDMRCLCMLHALSTHESYEIVSLSSSFLCMWHAFLSALLMQPVCR